MSLEYINTVEFTTPKFSAPLLEDIWKAVNILKALERMAYNYHHVLYTPEFEEEFIQLFQNFDLMLEELPKIIKRLEEDEKRIKREKEKEEEWLEEEGVKEC